MNINDYVKSLKGVISKDEVRANLEATIQDLTTKVLPILVTASAAFKTIKLKSEEVIGYDERYRTTMRLGRNATMFGDLEERLSKDMTKNLEQLRDMIEKSLPESVASSSIDHRSATLLHMVDNAAFVNRFTRRFIEAVTIYETEAVGMYEDYQKKNLNKGEAAWVDTRLGFFLEILGVMTDEPSAFKKKYDTIPMVAVDVTSNDNNKLFGLLRMDPFKLGFIPVSLNPFYHIGKWIVEYQAWRYKEAQEDLKRVQQRILFLEESVAGKGNPMLEKELGIQRDKAEGLTYKINKAEEGM